MEVKRFLQSRYSLFRELVGVVFTEIESGYSKSVLEVSEKLFNAGGFLHGGVAYTLADSGMGVALWASLGEDEVCSTIESKIVYFKAVSSGALTCEARLVQRSSNFAVMECEIKNDGKLAAKAIATFSVFKSKRKTGAQ